MINIKIQGMSAVLNRYFKRDNPTCVPYLRIQISALFFTPSHNYENHVLIFVLKQNMQLIKMCSFKLQVSNIELLRSIKMNSTQTDCQKNKTRNKIATAMTVQLEKRKFSSTRSQLAQVQFPIKLKPQYICLLYTSPSPRDGLLSRMPSSA